MDYSLPGSSVHEILQARILEWVTISFPRGSSQPRDWTWVSCIVARFFTNWAMREALILWEQYEWFLTMFQRHLYRLEKYVGFLHSVSSVAQSCLTLCNPMDCSTTGFPGHQLLERAQSHVYRGGDAYQFHPYLSVTIQSPLRRPPREGTSSPPAIPPLTHR